MMYVLDASALMAVLLEEPGADVVLDAERGSEINIVNVGEVMTVVVERGGNPEDVTELIQQMGLRVRAFRDYHALEGAKLRPPTRRMGLGIGDRTCLAQAASSQMPVLTSDTKWAELDLGIDIRQIR